jgi:hypothetical protein
MTAAEFKDEIAKSLINTEYLSDKGHVSELSAKLHEISMQYGERMTDWTQAHLLRNLRAICRVLLDHAEEKGYSAEERMHHCVQWYSNDLRSTLGPPRGEKEDRRSSDDRRDDFDRRKSSILVSPKLDRRKKSERRTEDRRLIEDRRGEE